MVTRTHTAACPEQYLIAQGLNPERVIYFDIETTGFRASTSSLYMIGWAVCADRVQPRTEDAYSGEACVWDVTQVMAENRLEERALLKRFLEVLAGYDTIIEFNGDRFDLPYVRGKCEEHGMPDPFAGIRTLDLYQLLRPYRTLLGMDRLNQKSVERFLHIRRTDPYDGGQLIDVYRAFRDHTAADPDRALDALFLHNYEDVLGMLQMTPLLAYRLAFESSAPVRVKLIQKDEGGEQEVSLPCETAGVDLPDEGVYLQAEYDLQAALPVPVSCDRGAWTFRAGPDTMTVRIPLVRRTLHHYFANYREYYYLPAERRVVHKSVGCFVNPAFRERAKAENCCVRKEGIFLPDPPEGTGPCFRASLKDRQQWFELTQAFLEDEEKVRAYIHSLVR